MQFENSIFEYLNRCKSFYFMLFRILTETGKWKYFKTKQIQTKICINIHHHYNK